jgi:H+-transporting ATPase
LLALIIITVLNDGTIVSIAYDRVRPSLSPEVWRLPRLFVVSLTLGSVALASSLLLLYILLGSHSPNGLWRRLGFSPLHYGHVTSAMYLKVSLSDFLTLFCARTRGVACSSTAFPSWQLLSAALLSLTASTTLAAHWPHALDGRRMSRAYLPSTSTPPGSLLDAVYKSSGNRMNSAKNDLLVFTWLYCVLWWGIMDLVKLALYWMESCMDARKSKRKAAALGPVVVTAAEDAS